MIPTLFELVGIKEHFPHNGLSLVPTMLGALDHHKDYAFSEGGFLAREEPQLEYAPWPYDLKAGLQHLDPTLAGKASESASDFAGLRVLLTSFFPAVSCRNKEWTYVYRLYEPAELYRRSDPGEVHNLAALPEYAGVVATLREALFRWMVETADLLPFKKDPRLPSIALATPAEQLQERLAKRSGKA